MIAVVSDTHGTDDHRLTGHALEAVRTAEAVVHAGDFTTEAVLDSVLAENGTLHAVAGNNDDPGVRERLPARRVLTVGDVRTVVVHGHEHDGTTLSLLARQEQADLVVVGHSHRPRVTEIPTATVLNPGSYADPRRYRPAYAELVPTTAGLDGRLYDLDGTVIESFAVAADE